MIGLTKHSTNDLKFVSLAHETTFVHSEYGNGILRAKIGPFPRCSVLADALDTHIDIKVVQVYNLHSLQLSQPPTSFGLEKGLDSVH